MKKNRCEICSKEGATKWELDEEEYFTDFEYERLACQCLVKGDVSIEQPKKSNKSPNVGPD